MFVLILKEHLPSNTDGGYFAKFGYSAPVVLTKVNQVNLKGTIPGKVFFSSTVRIFNHLQCNSPSLFTYHYSR